MNDGSMLRRRCGVVMDEEYVQEHILTDGIVAPVGGASPTHSWPLTAISLGVVASHPTHLFWTGRFCPTFESRRRSQQRAQPYRGIADQANAADDRRRAEVCLAGVP